MGHVCLAVPSTTDLNGRYQLVQWTLLHFHSGGKDFQISHKKD